MLDADMYQFFVADPYVGATRQKAGCGLIICRSAKDYKEVDISEEANHSKGWGAKPLA